MEILFEEQNDTLMILLQGELDHHNSVAGREKLTLKLSQKNYRRLIFNLEGLSFMDSSGISFIANGYKLASVFGTEIYVYTTNQRYLRLLGMANMKELCTILPHGKELCKLWKF